ncbi:MAG: hypothetical protein N4J56_008073 [Chroococcidiopsis sp. SAG 2025]|uniref:hypothetical protein n=1 Tax=Chroococcidiopsis sp. SAG 2025 TaxID=171389 RepID=UPI0029371114|nr:hypothetical protein [Chroococcidiopsis sp. SAG 2025]MDV2998368.1 hypothetical protein [Chroococcidiopsis sp. SAG 2025]
MKLPPRKKKIFPPVFPTDPVGAEFCKWFWSNSRGWNFIRSDLPAPGEKTRWTTEPYPIQPLELWQRHADPLELLGVGFKKFTRYLVIDIDRGSKYHPLNDEAKYAEILAILRSIGLNSPVVIRSSWSEGLHIYYPLPKAISSFGIACAVKWTLFDKGILLGDGQLETFPNTKSYGSDGNFVQYKCHRLPLQPESGSYLLDAMLEPYSDSVEDLLGEFNTAAAQQNLKLLTPVIGRSWSRQTVSSGFGSSGRVETWRRHLERRISTGWTAFSQTNGLIKDIATYGRVFLRLSGFDLIDYTVQTALNAPGYEQFCRHQQEIHRRVSDWSRCVEAYYWPKGSEPCRYGTYALHFHQELANDCPAAENNIVSFNASKSAEAQKRITVAVAHLESSGNLPATATARSSAIIAASKHLTGIGISQTTLHKPKYLGLWHPDHYHLQAQKCVIDCYEPIPAAPAAQSYPILPDPWDEQPEPQALPQQALSDNYTPPPLMKGFCIPCLPQAKEDPQPNSTESEANSLNSLNSSNSLPTESNSLSDKNYKSPISGSAAEKFHKPDLSIDASGIVDATTIVAPEQLHEQSTSLQRRESFGGSVSIEDCHRQNQPSLSSLYVPQTPSSSKEGWELHSSAPKAAPNSENSRLHSAAPADTQTIRRLIKIRLIAIQHAKKAVQSQSGIEGRKFSPQEREQRETIAKMRFLWESGKPVLMDEVLAWARANPDLLPEVKPS